MNQGRFRLVFSGLHGMMMAVAEFVSAQGKAEAAGDRSAPASAHESSDTPWFATRKCAFAALCLFGQPFCVVIEQAAVPVGPSGTFNNYGLSQGASVPCF
ncbi:ESPR-type extended signal peptide-containing protein [Caballeronia sp. M23-90]